MRRYQSRGNMLACALIFTAGGCALRTQQAPDKTFVPRIRVAAYAASKGPRLCLDEAHHNFHTLDNRFWAFGKLAERDGFLVSASKQSFNEQSLAQCDVLVISNAQWSAADWSKYPSPTPSAFTENEIAEVKHWVERGGSLLLIADHMPLAGAARQLALAFGVSFTDGFAVEGYQNETARDSAFQKPTLFQPGNGTLASHPIARGRDSTERISQVRSFTGQAFRITGVAFDPVLVLPGSFISLEPRYAWQFDDKTPREPVGGWLQGATRNVGKGRAAFFGEAAMFSAQVAGRTRQPMGMNAPMAEQNPQFVLNVLHWLTGLITAPGTPH